MSTSLTTPALTENVNSSEQVKRDPKKRRILVYTTDGKQIGLAGVGQRDNALTFPEHFLCGDALTFGHWIRKATTEELKQDSRWYRILSQAEKPLKLIHQVGDVPAKPEDSMGKYGDTVIAVIKTKQVLDGDGDTTTAETSSVSEVFNGHGMDEKLADIKTPTISDPF